MGEDKIVHKKIHKKKNEKKIRERKQCTKFIHEKNSAQNSSAKKIGPPKKSAK